MTEETHRIDIVDLLSVGLKHKEEPSVETYKTVGTQLVKAFADIGFVYVTNHGITDDVLNRVFEQSTELFSLTEEEKKNGLTRHLFQGYIATNKEKLVGDNDLLELRECYDVNNMQGVFPDKLVPQFRPAVGAIVEDLVALSRRLLRALEHGLGLSEDALNKCHSDMLKGSAKNATGFRVLHYPPVPSDAPTDTLRFGAHTDFGTVTILMQDKVGGLEVRERSGEWVAAIPLPGALLLNVGDLLQMWTKNVLIATEHRVLVPLDEHKQRQSRRSMAFFIYPDSDVVVKPLDGTKGTFEPVTALQYLNNCLARPFDY